MPSQAGVVGADRDGVLALVVEQNGFFFVFGERVGHERILLCCKMKGRVYCNNSLKDYLFWLACTYPVFLYKAFFVC